MTFEWKKDGPFILCILCMYIPCGKTFMLISKFWLQTLTTTFDLPVILRNWKCFIAIISSQFRKARKENITTQSVASPCTPHLSMMPIVNFTFDLQNRVHPFTMVTMSAKFDEEAHNSFNRVHKLIAIHINCDLDLWPLTSKTHRVHPLIIVNMCAK